MRTRRRIPIAVTLAALASGCALGDTQVAPWSNPTEDPPHLHLRLRDGVSIDGRRIELPRAFERIHYGAGVVDTSPLPLGWRAPHAPTGGILVAWVDRAAPLAIAGLRPYDLVLQLNGAPPASVDGVARTLALAPRVALRVRHLDGQEEEIEALAVDDVRARPGFGVKVVGPELFAARWSHLGFAMSIANVAWVNTSVRYAAPPDALSRSGYVRHFGWGALLSIFSYRSWTDLRTGAVTRTFTLFWALDLGDDPLEDL